MATDEDQLEDVGGVHRRSIATINPSNSPNDTHGERHHDHIELILPPPSSRSCNMGA